MQLVMAVQEQHALAPQLPDALATLMKDNGVEMRRRYEGAPEPALARWWWAPFDDHDRAQHIAGLLRGQPEVAQVYVKGDAQAPVLPPDETIVDRARRRAAPDASTPGFVYRQLHLQPAPVGVAAAAAWDLPGGNGAGVRIADIESAWLFDHEALRHATITPVHGQMSDRLSDRNHGTSVLGLLAGSAAIRGLCPAATFEVASTERDEDLVDDAILAAVRELGAGDVVLIEQERRSGPADGTSKGYRPVEWWPDVWDVIDVATSKGIIVVEPAGNGSVDLDGSEGETEPDLRAQPNPFLRGERDCGSIIVGAGAPPTATDQPDLSRLPFSGFGTCVDAQCWGLDVTTAGGYKGGAGDLQGGDEQRWYTDSFDGTSAAAAIVAGVLACVQGVLKRSGARVLTPLEARLALRSTGTPQTAAPSAPVTQRIGNRPDLAALIDFARRVAASPPDNRTVPRSRRNPMKITITIEDGDTTVTQSKGSADEADATSSLRTTSLSLPHVKGPTLGVVRPETGWQELGPLDDFEISSRAANDAELQAGP